eukprot:TRINITY_DN4393_c0_g1_i1.p1 TRINITY_DN4393_c0_g1~~TRINITY_DN4393_c0_g1_i1.p1  ORF type:complete len:234 (-),score=34.08 TRINITY_DN4393_c0_g1_i1:344-1045(-)
MSLSVAQAPRPISSLPQTNSGFSAKQKHNFRSFPRQQTASISFSSIYISGWNSGNNTKQLLSCKANTRAEIQSIDHTNKVNVNVARSASDIVKEFYSAINNHELDKVEPLLADNCVYEDLVYPKPFVGKQSIMDFFKKFTDNTSMDLRFVIDDISREDSSAAGVMWHLEWRGKHFPFSKGCSFYRCDIINGTRKIIYARDCVEAVTKPGSMTLVILKALTSLFERFPKIAERF